MPPEHRKVIERMMISSSVQMRSIVSPETAVMKKITTEHISQYLNGAEQEMKNSYAEKFHKKVFTFLSMIVAMIFFVIIECKVSTIYLKFVQIRAKYEKKAAI